MLPFKSLGFNLGLSLAAMSVASAQFVAYPDEMLKINIGSAPDTLELSWQGHAGRAYFLKYTPALETGLWTYLPVVEKGADALLSYGASAPAAGNRFFARTVVVPSTTAYPKNEDSDGDKISNMDEIQGGLDPADSVDSDTDNMPDDWEKFHFGDLARDGTEDYDGDGMSDADEYTAGRHPNTKIIYGTVLFYWKYEDNTTKTVYFGDLANESTMAATYSDAALTDVTSLTLYADARPVRFFDPEDYEYFDPLPDPVVEYTAVTPVDGAHALSFTGHTVNYYFERTGRDILRKIDGRPYKSTSDGKRVASYSTITSAPLTEISGQRFPAIFRAMPYGDSYITGYNPRYSMGQPIEYPDFGNHIDIISVENLLSETLSAEPVTYWRQPVPILFAAAAEYQIQNATSFAQWYNSLNAIPITLGIGGENEYSSFSGSNAYGLRSYDTSKLQANDVGYSRAGFSHTIETHFKLDYDLSEGASGTTLNYSCGDDLWLFINGKRIIDKGGVGSPSGSITLSEQEHGLIGTTGTCDVALYTAERWGGEAFLTLQSNSPLRPVYAYQVVVDTINNLPASFSLTTAPDGMTISPSGKIFWDYSSSPSDDYAVSVEVNDRNGNTSTQSFTITLDNTLTVKLLTTYAEVPLGENITIKPAITGAPAPTAFQWYNGETLLTSQTGPNLIITNAQYTDEGDYTVRATNADGTATSNSCYLYIY